MRKQRKTIKNEIINLVNLGLEKQKSIREISNDLNGPYNSVLKIANKINSGLQTNIIIVKKEEKQK